MFKAQSFAEVTSDLTSQNKEFFMNPRDILPANVTANRPTGGTVCSVKWPFDKKLLKLMMSEVATLCFSICQVAYLSTRALCSISLSDLSAVCE